MTDEQIGTAAKLAWLWSTPTRLRILLALEGRKHGYELVSAVGLSQPVVSKELRKLVEAGLIKESLDGRTKIYERADGGRTKRFVERAAAWRMG